VNPSNVLSLAVLLFAERARQCAGYPCVRVPSVLPWERGTLLDLTAPRAVAFHVLGNDGRLITHYRAVT